MGPNWAGSMVADVLILLVRLYQKLVSPLLGPTCRFEPSCSRYAMTCLERFGAARGSWLTIRRLCRCHPFHPGGVDLPPADGADARRGPGPGAVSPHRLSKAPEKLDPC